MHLTADSVGYQSITMPEVDPLILSFSHLAKLPRANDALQSLKKIASLVKPIMRNRRWKVKTLAEFYPNQPNLLGSQIQISDSDTGG